MNVDPAQATAYIINPLTGRKVSFAGLFQTHPPTAERVARLRTSTEPACGELEHRSCDDPERARRRAVPDQVRSGLERRVPTRSRTRRWSARRSGARTCSPTRTRAASASPAASS